MLDYTSSYKVVFKTSKYVLNIVLTGVQSIETRFIVD